ncbi:MAG: TIGR03862 family flavoprotein [Sulfuricurvum sp.]|uniref:TIGR03862 family flavoprotein n=1 Tax=Sulfuricurvum sp. TaxID=2025608 RepID=UPI0026332AFA|nr:TIGR03862 family flavoprotein [Sulfuricurvum sp.]MDD2368274.1 TIGR03862 family flavoprotein [Sulfuricurvum sp.]MDD5117197.1 TIGR03862 family flavoprotein [Sulfuricurvum sp.]
MNQKHIVIIGAGPAGLMAADILSAAGMSVDIYESKPSVGRKFLMAGKGGLNITHNEPIDDFILRYDQQAWLKPMIDSFDATRIRAWMKSLGVDSFVGTSGRVFPTEMKAAPLLRRWLSSLKKRGVRVHCRHYLQGITDEGSSRFASSDGEVVVSADATILALGGGSWASLGSDGAWINMLASKGVEINPLLPSNCGFKAAWSEFIKSHLGKPLKNISGWVGNREESVSSSEAVLTTYGIEGGLVYALSRPLREEVMAHGTAILYLDLLPYIAEVELISRLTSSSKQSTDNIWRKAGLETVKGALIRELLPKNQWSDPIAVAACIKRFPITITEMQPIDEAISTAGGVKREALTEDLMLKVLPNVFCAGEMLDWDAPTGGYLLTASFASGVFAANGVLKTLRL